MKIKICGIKNSEDAKKACQLGAWGLGFIFYEKSPRYIDPQKADQIIKSLDRSILETVGVFVNETVERMNEVQKLAGFSIFQLHGEESPAKVSKIKGKVIKKINPADLGHLESYLHCHPDITFLVDAPPSRAGFYGGRGQLADWSFANKVKKKGPLILAGGLCEKNLKEAFQCVDPFAFDLSSSVEKSPGLKDHQKLTDFFYHIKKEIMYES